MKVHVSIRTKSPELILFDEDTLDATSTAAALRAALKKPGVACHLQDLRSTHIKVEAWEVKE